MMGEFTAPIEIGKLLVRSVVEFLERDGRCLRGQRDVQITRCLSLVSSRGNNKIVGAELVSLDTGLGELHPGPYRLPRVVTEEESGGGAEILSGEGNIKAGQGIGTRYLRA